MTVKSFALPSLFTPRVWLSFCLLLIPHTCFSTSTDPVLGTEIFQILRTKTPQRKEHANNLAVALEEFCDFAAGHISERGEKRLAGLREVLDRATEYGVEVRTDLYDTGDGVRLSEPGSGARHCDTYILTREAYSPDAEVRYDLSTDIIKPSGHFIAVLNDLTKDATNKAYLKKLRDRVTAIQKPFFGLYPNDGTGDLQSIFKTKVLAPVNRAIGARGNGARTRSAAPSSPAPPSHSSSAAGAGAGSGAGETAEPVVEPVNDAVFQFLRAGIDNPALGTEYKAALTEVVKAYDVKCAALSSGLRKAIDEYEAWVAAGCYNHGGPKDFDHVEHDKQLESKYNDAQTVIKNQDEAIREALYSLRNIALRGEGNRMLQALWDKDADAPLNLPGVVYPVDQANFKHFLTACREDAKLLAKERCLTDVYLFGGNAKAASSEKSYESLLKKGSLSDAIAGIVDEVMPQEGYTADSDLDLESSDDEEESDGEGGESTRLPVFRDITHKGTEDEVTVDGLAQSLTPARRPLPSIAPRRRKLPGTLRPPLSLSQSPSNPSARKLLPKTRSVVVPVSQSPSPVASPAAPSEMTFVEEGEPDLDGTWYVGGPSRGVATLPSPVPASSTAPASVAPQGVKIPLPGVCVPPPRAPQHLPAPVPVPVAHHRATTLPVNGGAFGFADRIEGAFGKEDFTLDPFMTNGQVVTAFLVALLTIIAQRLHANRALFGKVKARSAGAERDAQLNKLNVIDRNLMRAALWVQGKLQTMRGVTA